MNRLAPTSNCFLSYEAYTNPKIPVTQLLRTSNETESDTDLVDPYWLSEQLDLVHDLASVLGIFFRQEFAETESLMRLRDSIFW